MSLLISQLRAAIEDERATAAMISGGGYAPDIWEAEGVVGNWAQIISKSRVNNEPREAAIREDENPVAFVQTGRNEHLHLLLHDPDKVVRRATAMLKILEEHSHVLKMGSTINGKELLYYCSGCGGRDWELDSIGYKPCPTVLALAEAYGIEVEA